MKEKNATFAKNLRRPIQVFADKRICSLILNSK
jgi:hypothetical protein